MQKRVKVLLHEFWRRLPFGLFVAAILCLCFVYGIAVGKWQVFPHDFLNKGWESLRELKKTKRQHFLRPARYEDEGVNVCRYEQVCPGVTLLAGHWRDGNCWNVGLRLIDLNGKVLHEWRCDAKFIWERSPYQDGTEPDISDTYVHGSLLLPSGEVIFNLEYFGLVKLNSRSEVIWKLPYRTHHSMFQDDSDNIWVCRAKWHKDHCVEFPGLRPPFLEDTVLKVSKDGIVEREISVLETIYKSGFDGLLRLDTGDILHLNDIEVLSEQKADNFDLFQAGDIMLSLHSINTVLVIDGETERIKWSMTYPFVGQHDPDFTDDGHITVFDNHMDQRFPMSDCNGSRIVRIEPSTRKATTLYGWKESQRFYSAWCGKHQHLPNGNLLITEAVSGRVFEVNGGDEVVWSWIAPRWAANSVSEITEGTRYGVEYADFINGSRKDKK